MAIHAGARLCAVAAVLTGAAASKGAVVLSDNFDDGNDDGWSRADPNNVQFNEGLDNGPYTLFDASTGAYRIRAFPGPVAGSPSRAGAYRADQAYRDFSIGVDLTALDTAVNQRVGILARLGQVGYGSTDGYLLNYSPSPGRAEGGALQIRRMTDELTTVLATADVSPPLSATGNRRLVFSGVGGALTGKLLDSTGSLLASATAVDTTHDGPGFAGLWVENRNNFNADATFDNFIAVPEPASVAVLGLAAAGLLLRRRRRNG